MEKKDLRFEIKAVGDDGTFEGYLSVYGVVDYGNDVVEPGAFTKTIEENKGVVPMLWQHDEKQPIGELELMDTPQGLRVKGKFVLEVERAREAYALVKANVIRGMSIGYKAVKKEMSKGVRRLKEVQLFEGSVVTFPMNPAAQIETVKSAVERKEEFVAELERIRLHSMRWMLMDALQSSLYSTLYDSMDADAKVAASGEAIDQFKAAYMEYLPQYLAMDDEMKSADQKAGRRISATSRSQIEEAIAKLQALLTDDESTEAAAVVADEAAKSASEPDALHSWLQSFRQQLKAAA